MRKETISEAIGLARVFIKRGLELTKEDYYTIYGKPTITTLSGSKRTAALRRASMELTRALTEMRKP